MDKVLLFYREAKRTSQVILNSNPGNKKRRQEPAEIDAA